ncbi:MAG TPA: energy transducer TonB [Gemmatimonadales bacterium]|nr:energy transducer TonB [Gemmatimonadales bacterium]
MQLTLLESDRSFFRTAEYATVSIVAHVGIVWVILATATGTFRLPTNEREARVLFLLPPDPVAATERQADILLPGRPGSGLDQAGQLPAEGEGLRLLATTKHARHRGERGGALKDQPFGPAPHLAEIVYSALQVDETVQRYEGSAAPVYPPELSAQGKEGKVDAMYVVDTTGRVDTTTFQVLQSDDLLFTESVRTSLGEALFRPAKRAGQPVRQLVQQRFNFKLAQP